MDPPYLVEQEERVAVLENAASPVGSGGGGGAGHALGVGRVVSANALRI